MAPSWTFSLCADPSRKTQGWSDQTHAAWWSGSTMRWFQERSRTGHRVWNLKASSQTDWNTVKLHSSVQERKACEAEWSWRFGGRRCNFDTSRQIRAAVTSSNYSFRQTRKMITSGESFVTFVLHSTLTDVARSRTSSRHGGTKQNCQVRSPSGL